MKNLVGVKHIDKGIMTQAYWFEVKSELLNLKYGDWVLVDTMYGPATAKVIYEPILISRDEDVRTLHSALGCKGQLRQVINKIEYESSEEPPF